MPNIEIKMPAEVTLLNSAPKYYKAELNVGNLASFIAQLNKGRLLSNDDLGSLSKEVMNKYSDAAKILFKLKINGLDDNINAKIFNITSRQLTYLFNGFIRKIYTVGRKSLLK